jgi:hypothetical protein
VGLAVETVVGYLDNAASTGAQALTVVSPQSFSVRATNGSTVAWLASMWGDFQDTGSLRVRSPRLHDDVNGIEIYVPTTNPNPVTNEGFLQELYSQDTLTVEGYYTAAPTAGHYSFGAMQIYYDDLPGVAGSFQTWAQVQPQIKSYMGVIVEPESAAALGSWGAGVAINSYQDVFKANGAYALLGYITPVTIPAWSILGSDLGNMYVGGPGSTDPWITRGWFIHQDQLTGKPSIPVINAQNKAGTTVQVVGPATSTTYNMTLLFAYLGQFSGS